MTRPTSVSAEMSMRLLVPGSASLPVRAGLRYEVSDPYAVAIGFHTASAVGEGEVVEWTFARQLLTDGVAAPVGDGDVQVWPSTSSGAPVVCLSLCSPSGKALFELPLPELVDFLGRTYDAVPTGAESAHVDVDAELALLLWAEPGL
jgi:Streptomyces sporulation and cell division protein, SsgA